MECKKVVVELKNEKNIKLKIGWQKSEKFLKNYTPNNDLDHELWNMLFSEIYDAIVLSQIQLSDIRAIYFENCNKCEESFEKEKDDFSY